MTPEQKTLFSTLDFCKNYDLEAWIQERNTCNLLLLGTKNSFQSIKDKPNYFLLNEEYIKKFPSGFFDTNIVPYNLNKNWRHFCDLIDDEKFISYFNNNKNILSFSNTLDTIFTNYPKKNVTYILFLEQFF